MATRITKKFSIIEVLGTADIALSSLSVLSGNAAKIYGPTTTTGGSRQSFTPGVGGTLQVMKPGFGYEVVSVSTTPDYDIPGIRVLYGGSTPVTPPATDSGLLSLGANDAILFQMTGQSNAVGQAPTSYLSGLGISPNPLRTFSRVYIQQENASPVPLQVGVNNYAESAGKFGLEARIAQEFEARYPQGILVIAKLGFGGTGIDAMSRGTGLYDRIVNGDWNRAKSWIAAQGKTLKRRVTYHHQGEADKSDTGYLAKLTQLFQDYQTDGAFNSSEMTIIGGLWSKYQGYPAYQARLDYVAADTAHRRYSSNLDANTLDDEHYDGAWLWSRGVEVFEQMAAASFSDTVPGNINPAAPSFSNMVDTDAGGSIQITPAPGVPIEHVFYQIPGGSATRFATGSNGVIEVGNVGGSVVTWSEAFTGYNASPSRTSAAFTAYTAPAGNGPAWPAGLPYVAKFSADLGQTNQVAGQGDLREMIAGQDFSNAANAPMPTLTANALGSHKAWRFAESQGFAANLNFGGTTAAVAVTIKYTGTSPGGSQSILFAQWQSNMYYFVEALGLPVGQWATLVLFKEGGVSKYMVNGVLTTGGSFPALQTGLKAYLIGRWEGGNYQTQGDMADFAVIDGELSPAQATSLHNALKAYHGL